MTGRCLDSFASSWAVACALPLLATLQLPYQNSTTPERVAPLRDRATMVRGLEATVSGLKDIATIIATSAMAGTMAAVIAAVTNARDIFRKIGRKKLFSKTMVAVATRPNAAVLKSLTSPTW